MKSTRKVWNKVLLTAILVVGFVAFVGGLPSMVGAWGNHSKILPIQEEYFGKNYSEWAAKWWKWTIETPADVNPNLGKGDCAMGQQGPVWFLATTLGSGKPVERECTVPFGKALFFPLINASYGAFLNDPEETRTEAYVRMIADCGIPTKLEAEIDGVSVKNLYQYFEHSPLFAVTLPYPNVYGVDPGIVPEDRLEPMADQGYYLFVWSLSPGSHTIKWKAAWNCPYFGDFSEDITYNLDVKKKWR
jgi:hypothetical protein